MTIEEFFQKLNSQFDDSNINNFMAGPAWACSEVLDTMLEEWSEQMDISFSYKDKETGQPKRNELALYDTCSEMLDSDSDEVLITVFQTLLAEDYTPPTDPKLLMLQGLALSSFYSVMLDESINIDLFALMTCRSLMLVYKIGQIVAFTPQLAVEKIQQKKAAKTFAAKKKTTKKIVIEIYNRSPKISKLGRNAQAAFIEKRLPYKTDPKTGKQKRITKRTNIIKILNNENLPSQVSKT